MDIKPVKAKMSVLMSLLIIVLALMWLARRCSVENSSLISNRFQRPDDSTLVVAIELSPTSYVIDGDSVTGLDYSILRDIANEHGLNITFHPFAPLDYAFTGLRRGDFDIVVANVPSSRKINDEFLVTENIFTDRQVLVTRRDSTIDSAYAKMPPQMRLLGDTVWVTASSPFGRRLRNLADELGDSIYVRSTPGWSAEHLVIMTALGEIKQAVVNESVAQRLAADYPNLDISVAISLNQSQPWILAKGREALRDSLNIWIREYKQTAAYDSIMKRYEIRAAN